MTEKDNHSDEERFNMDLIKSIQKDLLEGRIRDDPGERCWKNFMKSNLRLIKGGKNEDE